MTMIASPPNSATGPNGWPWFYHDCALVGAECAKHRQSPRGAFSARTAWPIRSRRTFKKDFAIWRVSTLGLAATIAVLTLLPQGSMQAIAAPGGDKLAHTMAFCGLILPTAILRPHRLGVVMLQAFIFGIIIEIVQPLMGRSSDIVDSLANGVGLVIGAALGLAGKGLFNLIKDPRHGG